MSGLLAGKVTVITGAGNGIGAAASQFGRVDVLVNNAGLTRDGLFVRMTDAQWAEVLDTNLGGAFHSPLMAPAAEGLAAALDATAFHDPRCPVVANAWARPVRRADEVRSALRAQLLAPVRWEESLRLLLAEGLDGFVELGPGRVLRGLLRTLAPAAASWNVEDPGSLAATLSALAPAAGRNA